MRRLTDSIVVITGGNTGIGRAVALAYAREGADIAIAWAEREPEAHSVVTAIEREGRRALAVRCEVTVEEQVSALVARVLDHFGRVDVLVSNAGIQKAQALTETSVADWDRMKAVHLRGAFLCCARSRRT